jgi:hypothetical protein
VRGNAALVYADIVRHWLREEPSDYMDEFGEQIARALELESRILRQQGAVTANLIATLMGAK